MVCLGDNAFAVQLLWFLIQSKAENVILVWTFKNANFSTFQSKLRQPLKPDTPEALNMHHWPGVKLWTDGQKVTETRTSSQLGKY